MADVNQVLAVFGCQVNGEKGAGSVTLDFDMRHSSWNGLLCDHASQWWLRSSMFHPQSDAAADCSVKYCSHIFCMYSKLCFGLR